MKKKIFPLIFIMQSFVSIAQVNVQDSLALVALYNATDGVNWTYPWQTNMPVNSWIGVTLENHRVTMLQLPNMGLNGTIPPEIGNLDSIKIIWLNDNNLHGAIPPEIGNLTGLTDLDLSKNQLTGSIPVELFNLVNLKNLSLFLNFLSGNLPPQIGNLLNIRFLYIQQNDLSGELPPELYNLTTLNTLWLDRNQFIGDISGNIYSLINLNWLSITNNRFENLPDLTYLCSNYSLNTFYCVSNKLTFEDLELNTGNTWQHFSYSPQDSVLYPVDTLVNIGSTVSFTSLVGGTQNHYQWYKDSLPLSNDTFPVLVLNSVAFADSGTYTCKIVNSIVTGLTLDRHLIKLHIKDTSNVVNSNKNESYAISPNPFNDVLTITPSDINKIEVVNINGEILLSKILNLPIVQTINLSTLPSGLYFLKLYKNEKIITKKIIKN